MAEQTKSGRAYPRGFGAIVACDDGTEELVRNGLNARHYPLAPVTILKTGSRWSIVERPR